MSVSAHNQTHSQDKRLSELIRLTNSGGKMVGEGGEENNTAPPPQPLDTWSPAGGKSLDLSGVLYGCCFPALARPIWLLAASVAPLKETRYNTHPPHPEKNILPPLLSVPAIVTVREAASGGIIRNVRGTSWTVAARCRKYASGPLRQTGSARRRAVAGACCVLLMDILVLKGCASCVGPLWSIDAPHNTIRLNVFRKDDVFVM